MQADSAIQTPSRQSRKDVKQQIGAILLRKLWLPRAVYEVLPYLYILLGVAALVSAVFTPDWTWILPYAILVGLICLHAGLAIATLRYRFRRRGRSPRQKLV